LLPIIGNKSVTPIEWCQLALLAQQMFGQGLAKLAAQIHEWQYVEDVVNIASCTIVEHHTNVRRVAVSACLGYSVL
jgi:hypothetical protein